MPYEKGAPRKERPGGLPVVVERMKLGLLAIKFFGRNLDGSKVRQVELEKENGIFSSLPLELLDGLFRLLL